MKRLYLLLFALLVSWGAHAAAVSTTDANQLFDLAESRYTALFPGHKTTGTFSPFLYRYYPETGMYVGIAVTANANFQLNGVYVMGGPFAGVTYVGPITAFITTT